MTRPLKLAFSDVRDLLGALGNLGVTAEQIMDVVHSPSKLKTIVAALQPPTPAEEKPAQATAPTVNQQTALKRLEQLSPDSLNLWGD